MANKNIAVIGGGPAGTAAAHALAKLGYDVTIYEKQPAIGGRVQSRAYKGENYELGAAFVTKGIYPQTFKVLEESGLIDDLRYRRCSYSLYKDDRIITPWYVLNNSWLSFGAKIEVARSLLLSLPKVWGLHFTTMPRAAVFDTEDSEQLFRNPYRQQIADYLVDPFVDGYCYWSPKRTSKAMFMLFAREALLKGKTYTLRHGLQQIPTFLAHTSTVITDCDVQQVTKSTRGTYELHVKQAGKVRVFGNYCAVVCATTASVVPKLFHDLTPAQKAFFTSITYSSTVNVARCYERSNRKKSQAIVFPTVVGKPFSSIVADSDTSDSGTYVEVIKAYANGTKGKTLCTKKNDEIIRSLTFPKEAQRQLSATNKPEHITVQKWTEALPEFNVGHMRKLKEFAEGSIETDQVVFAGDYIGGPYIDGAIRSGFEAAERLHQRLQHA